MNLFCHILSLPEVFICISHSREAESENASLVVQGMLIDFECRFLERKAWRILFDVSLYLDGAHIFGIHGNAKEPA